MSDLSERELQNRILKILQTKNKNKSAVEIYLNLTPDELNEALDRAKLNYRSYVLTYWNSIEQAISIFLKKSQLNKLEVIPPYIDKRFQQRAQSLQHPTLTEDEFNKIATIFRIANPDWPSNMVRVHKVPIPLKSGVYDDSELVKYLTNTDLDQFKESFSIRLLLLNGMQKVQAGMAVDEAVDLLKEQLAQYQLLLVKLYFGTLEDFAKNITLRTSHDLLKTLSNKENIREYIKRYILPHYPEQWPTYNDFICTWSPPTNHPSPVTIAEKIYHYFSINTNTTTEKSNYKSSPRYKKRERGLWRRVGEELGAKVGSRSRQYLSKEELDKKLATFYENHGTLSQKLVPTGLHNWVIKYYENFIPMQKYIMKEEYNVHATRDGKVLDSLAEVRFYDYLLEIKPQLEWLLSIEPHQELLLENNGIKKKFRVDFILNSDFVIEVEMVDSTQEHGDNTMLNAYAKRNREKRTWFSKTKTQHIFLQQSDCLSKEGLVNTVALLNTLVSGRRNAPPLLLEYIGDKKGLNYWSKKGTTKKHFDEALAITLKSNHERLTINQILSNGITGLREAFYRLPKVTQQAWLKPVQNLLVQTPQFVDGKLTLEAWEALKLSLINTRGVMMTDRQYKKLDFDVTCNFSVMLTVTRHFAALKDLAVHFGLGWLASGNAISYALNSVKIENNNVRTTIEGLDAISDEKLQSLKEYFTKEEREQIRKVQNSYCYNDGEILQQVKIYISSLIRSGHFNQLRKEHIQLYVFINKNLGIKVFKEAIGYREGMVVDDWHEPDVWPTLTAV